MRFDRERSVFIAGDRTWPVHPESVGFGDETCDLLTMYTRRIRIAFENGWAASIIWGSMTYSDNHRHGWSDHPFVEEPVAVEVGVMSRDRGLCPGEPYGWVSAEQLNKMLDVIRHLHTDDDEITVAASISLALDPAQLTDNTDSNEE